MQPGMNATIKNAMYDQAVTITIRNSLLVHEPGKEPAVTTAITMARSNVSRWVVDVNDHSIRYSKYINVI